MLILFSSFETPLASCVSSRLSHSLKDYVSIVWNHCCLIIMMNIQCIFNGLCELNFSSIRLKASSQVALHTPKYQIKTTTRTSSFSFKSSYRKLNSYLRTLPIPCTFDFFTWYKWYEIEFHINCVDCKPRFRSYFDFAAWILMGNNHLMELRQF